MITFEFESDKKGFFPYIGHGDNLGHAEFILFESGGKYKGSFITSVDGWQYFEIGDKRNTSENVEKYGGLSYYFRIISSHICNKNDYDIIENEQSLMRKFLNSESEIDVLEMKFPENGIYQMKVTSKEVEKDKFSFVFGCDSGRVAAGNDDEDYYSDLMDPLIYSELESNLRNLFVTGKIQSDLNSSGVDEYTVSLKRQPSDKELEPNNLFNYSNVITSGSISGKLSEISQIVLGEEENDKDWFKFDLLKGQLIDLSITAGNDRDFSAEIWAGSYSVTGTSIIPLRYSALNGLETHRINMMMPLTGSAFLMLDGVDVPYDIKVTQEDDIPVLMTFDDKVLKTIDSPDCGWVFYKWNMPENGDFFEIYLAGETSKAGMHIFSSDFLPFAFIEPALLNRFFIHRNKETESLYLGFYFNECEQLSGQTIDLKITGQKENIIEWNKGLNAASVKFSGNGSYQGFIDTDNNIVENFFDIDVEADGTLYLSTSLGTSAGAFYIDTVLTLYKSGQPVDSNDDMIEYINYNKYSYLRHDVKRGEKYRVKVSPFMTESSDIPSMNITSHYILDIIIK